jgi:hypothetical protein
MAKALLSFGKEALSRSQILIGVITTTSEGSKEMLETTIEAFEEV